MPVRGWHRVDDTTDDFASGAMGSGAGIAELLRVVRGGDGDDLGQRMGRVYVTDEQGCSGGSRQRLHDNVIRLRL